MILLLGEINCSKYFVKRVSRKCISIKECARVHNLKFEVQSVRYNYFNIISQKVLTILLLAVVWDMETARFWVKLKILQNLRQKRI
jgi:hypothetical protein